MRMMNRRLYRPSKETFELATKKLRAGNIVSFPTETVYGLGADAKNNDAVAKIFAAKNRPNFNPLIVHLSGANKASLYVKMCPLAQKLADNFWPGPFTMVLPLNEKSGLSDLITAGLNTVAIRVPKNDIAQKLLHIFNGPIAAPSANKSGHVSPTTAAHVESEFGAELEMIIDGGSCEKGIESTIVQVENNSIILLRPGNVTAEDIKKATGHTVQIINQPTDNPIAPGQLKSHYAPNAQLRLNVTEPRTEEVYLAFGHTSHRGKSLNLSPSGDLTEAASNLFSMMRELDSNNVGIIAVAPIPNTGLGIAINDRLARAAAPRDTKNDD